MRVSAGMRDLRSYYVRANTCVACHQNIDADIIKAGHPELVFELDGQSVSEPKHWRDDDPAGGPRAWLVGQAVALREMSWMLAKQNTTDADNNARWHALVWLLAKATANETRLQAIESPGATASRDSFATVQRQADLLARQAAAIPWDDRRTAAMLDAHDGNRIRICRFVRQLRRRWFSVGPHDWFLRSIDFHAHSPTKRPMRLPVSSSLIFSKTFAHSRFSPKSLPSI